MSNHHHKNEPDYGESFVPGAGPERLAPKSLDHFQRGHRERAEHRDKECYTRRAPPQPRREDRSNERPTILQGFHVLECLDRLTHLEQDRRKVFAELDRARSQYPEPFDNGKALTALISSAARRRNVHMAGMIWAWMDVAHVAKNTFHYNSMISATEKSRNYRQALALLREMEQRNIPKNEVTFSSAISACEKCGEWRTALDLLDGMEREGIQRTAIAYNAAISACEKAMLPQKACDVFRRMKREGIKPSVVSYSALISAAEKGGQWKLALEILEEMKAEGYHGNVVAYSAAISALAKGQQWQLALSLFREVQACGGQPSIVTYNATMTALEKSLEWERALDMFDEMKSRNLPITVVSYGSCISACDKGLQYRQCLEYLDEMTEMGIPKNVIIFGAAMSCMEKCCRADIGFQLMERMRIEGIQPNVHVYNSAISACARSNLWEKGYELFREMDEVGVKKDVVTYNAILDAVCSQIKLGRTLFEEGVRKGFYARVSRLGEQWFELDLHFLSLGGGEIALGWWFEECLVPYLMNTERLKAVNSISIVTGYGKTRTRGRRFGDDGMRKRCKAMLGFMNIKEVDQANAGRIHIDKDALIEEANKNGGKIIFDLDGYLQWKETETTANVVPDTVQKIRPRFKPAVPGSGGPPFIRIETELTSPEYRLENAEQNTYTDHPVPEEPYHDEARPPHYAGRDYMNNISEDTYHDEYAGHEPYEGNLDQKRTRDDPYDNGRDNRTYDDSRGRYDRRDPKRSRYEDGPYRGRGGGRFGGRRGRGGPRRDNYHDNWRGPDRSAQDRGAYDRDQSDTRQDPQPQPSNNRGYRL
ncbi:hypothetical protein FisN_7Hh296 [Fistulifera solaris]|uniref:Pentacotripeptide-repeat region of PRORP domain-containing protein n=1 Tax=Fistulifera solaris TaxID=1519565 RepID=A0A1Z5KSE0_FISSO|nr:hypothetical protein FisN_7Hh296 [Fistulifera solaris]|eukprot:GAX29107.1 hypothetical protein FisN_7Hh296 [Fistulifera solaris]